MTTAKRDTQTAPSRRNTRVVRLTPDAAEAVKLLALHMTARAGRPVTQAEAASRAIEEKLEREKGDA